MQLFNKIKSNIYDPVYYSEVLKEPFSSSLRYLLSLLLLLSLIGTIIFSAATLPELNTVMREIGPNVLKYYPDELEIAVKNGKVSTNVEEPYYIRIPDELKNEFKKSENRQDQNAPDLAKMDNLIVIDTKSNITFDVFKNYKTFAVLAADSIIIYDNGAMKVQPLDQQVNGVLDKAKVAGVLSELSPYINIIPYALVPIVFFGSYLGSTLGYLLYMLFGAFVIWIAAQAVKKPMDYAACFKVGLHAITFGAILEFTLFWFYPQFQIPFFFTFLMVVVVWINLNFASDAGNVLPANENPPKPNGEIK